jgi:hypothetical protein
MDAGWGDDVAAVASDVEADPEAAAGVIADETARVGEVEVAAA